MCAKMTPDDAAKLLSGIGANVKAMGANIAARLSQTGFGVVTDDPHAAKGLAQCIQSAAHEQGLKSLKIEEVLVSLKGQQLTPEQNVLALRHVIGRFSEGKLKTVPGSDLSQMFDQMMKETVEKAQDFTATVANGAFELAFQPIVDLKTGTASHYEALTRFEPGQSPAEMITFAEELGLTDAFDLAVVVKVFNVLERDSTITAAVALNVSGRSIATPATFAMLAGLLARKRQFAKRVLIEITESAEISDLATADKAIQSLREMGYRVGIDDFGAGAASLQYLHGFTVDFVKVDGGVVQRLGKSPREDALLKSVVRTCHELHIETIAEFIDSPERKNLCIETGFDLGQGYLFGKAVNELPRPVPSPLSRARRKGVQETWG
jgi:EAL domain-containing protein (putative c-di-GMP-specific phosphodiesterase class I)